MALTATEGFVVYTALRKYFDSLKDNSMDNEYSAILISGTHKLAAVFQSIGDIENANQFRGAATQMEQDSTFFPQPPASCVTKQEWLKRVSSERP